MALEPSVAVKNSSLSATTTDGLPPPQSTSGSAETQYKDQLHDCSDQPDRNAPPSWSPSATTEHIVDDRFVLPKCELPPRNEFEPVETFVATAVREQHEQKPNDNVPLKNYKGILEALRFKRDIRLLTKILLAMRTSRNTMHFLTSVSSKHARLIHQIVRFNPFQLPTSQGDSMDDTDAASSSDTDDYSLADAHLHLVVALLSANSVFLVPAVTALWKLLISDGQKTPDKRQQRLHAALATIVRLCPKGKMELFPIISSNAPFRARPEDEITWYYRQCLYVLEYIPGIEGQVIDMLIDKSLEMDVEIKIADSGEAMIERNGDDADTDVENMFQLDLEDQKETKPKLPASATVDEMADKLDSLILLIFEHIEKRMSGGADAYGLCQEVFRAFESSILITHNSKYVQYLVFHMCGLESRYVTSPTDTLLLYREFAAKLIEVILDPYRATVTRQSGACYLASFVSRASYVCPETVCEAVSALLRWTEAYTDSLGILAIHAADIRNQCSLHSLFYTICQSAFYIMCFRGVDAVKFYTDVTSRDAYDEPERIDVGEARWTRLCSHPLQPLRWCLESVRSEFLVISTAFNLINEETLKGLVSDNSRMATGRAQRKRQISKVMTPAMLEKERQTGGVGGLGQGANPQEIKFFPYDPYLLRRSNRFVEPFYKHWQGSLAEQAIVGEAEDAVADEIDIDADNEESSPKEIYEDGDASERASDSEDEDEDIVAACEHSKSAVSETAPMSFTSNSSSLSSRIPSDVVGKSKAAQEQKWTAALKRSRAPSIENGSW